MRLAWCCVILNGARVSKESLRLEDLVNEKQKDLAPNLDIVQEHIMVWVQYRRNVSQTLGNTPQLYWEIYMLKLLTWPRMFPKAGKIVAQTTVRQLHHTLSVLKLALMFERAWRRCSNSVVLKVASWYEKSDTPQGIVHSGLSLQATRRLP